MCIGEYNTVMFSGYARRTYGLNVAEDWIKRLAIYAKR